MHPEDVGDALIGLELHVVPFAAPLIPRAVEKVFNRIGVARADAQLPDRQLHPSLLLPVGIDGGNDEDSLVGRGSWVVGRAALPYVVSGFSRTVLAEEQEVRIVGRMKLQ